MCCTVSLENRCPESLKLCSEVLILQFKNFPKDIVVAAIHVKLDNWDLVH